MGNGELPPAGQGNDGTQGSGRPPAVGWAGRTWQQVRGWPWRWIFLALVALFLGYQAVVAAIPVARALASWARANLAMLSYIGNGILVVVAAWMWGQAQPLRGGAGGKSGRRTETGDGPPPKSKADETPGAKTEAKPTTSVAGHPPAASLSRHSAGRPPATRFLSKNPTS